MKIGEILVLGIPQFMPKSDNGLCWPRQARHRRAGAVWVTGNLESVGGILIKIWTNFNKKLG